MVLSSPCINSQIVLHLHLTWPEAMLVINDLMESTQSTLQQ